MPCWDWLYFPRVFFTIQNSTIHGALNIPFVPWDSVYGLGYLRVPGNESIFTLF